MRIILIVISCLLILNCQMEYLSLRIDYNITGTTDSYVVINNKDYGSRTLPFHVQERRPVYNGDAIHYKISCYSTNPINLTIKENDILVFDHTALTIDYEK